MHTASIKNWSRGRPVCVCVLCVRVLCVCVVCALCVCECVCAAHFMHTASIKNWSRGRPGNKARESNI